VIYVVLHICEKVDRVGHRNVRTKSSEISSGGRNVKDVTKLNFYTFL